MKEPHVPEHTKIVKTIPAARMREAMRILPPARIAANDFMDSQTLNAEGRPVMVRFKRSLFEHQSIEKKCGWVFESARFLDVDTAGHAD
jgi:hypothetical protein